MEGEINNFILVWSCAILSVYYCNVVSNILPKGLPRFIAILPVVCLFLFLPLHSLYSYHLGFPSVFCLSWLANFKLILLSFGSGPLSDESLPLPHFFGLALLPIIKTQENNTSSSRRSNALKSPSQYVVKAMFMPSALFFYAYRDSIHPTILMHYYTLCVYMGLEVVLGICATIAQSFLGLELDQPFDKPYLSTSVADHWGKRWNLVSADILRLTIFRPIYRYFSKTLGRSSAYILAIMASFLVSGVMHELMNYQMFRPRTTWRYIYFFVMQGLFVVVEGDLKKKLGGGPPAPPRLLVSVAVLLLTMCTFGWIVMAELMEQNIDSVVVKEYVIVCDFFMNLLGFQGKVVPLANTLFGTTWLHITLVMTATVCCWMMWAIVYLAQMNPLIVPILSEGE